MRRIFWSLLAIGIVAAVPATAGDTGACWVEFNAGNQDAVECIDDVTQDDCEDFCSSCTWDESTDCVELEFPWEGSCFFDDTPPGGGCWLWAVEPGDQSAEFHCEETFDGDWSDDLVCGGAPVPTLPRAGQAALVLVLLTGALIVLSLHSKALAG